MRRLRDLLRGDRVIVAAALVIVGIGVMIHATAYELGTLRRMGPGYFPLLLGASLCAIGVLTFFEPDVPDPVEGYEDRGTLYSKLRAFALVLSGILLFVLLVRPAGFVPATAICLIVAGTAEPDNSLLELVLLSIAVTLFATLVFVVGLGIPVRLVNI